MLLPDDLGELSGRRKIITRVSRTSSVHAQISSRGGTGDALLAMSWVSEPYLYP
jgi:hypothetical protein